MVHSIFPGRPLLVRYSQCEKRIEYFLAIPETFEVLEWRPNTLN